MTRQDENAVREIPQGAASEKHLENGMISIALGADAPFIPHLAATVASVVRNAPGARFQFLILHTGVEKHRQAGVEGVAPGARFTWIEISDADLPAVESRKHFTRAALFRLGLERLAPPGFERVIYLDSDVIVVGDIRELWRIDLGGRPLAAVMDVLLDAEEFRSRWQLPASSMPCFNSGVLLIDLDVVRAEGSFSRAIAFFSKHIEEMQFFDQDALNHEFWGRWHPIDLVWNVQRDVVYAETTKNLPEDRRLNGRMPALVHFTSEVKPWTPTPERFHPWAWIYWDNLSRTPFLREVAVANGVSAWQRFRLWLRWMKRRPRPNRR